MAKKHLRPVFDDDDDLDAMLRKHEEENKDWEESEDEFATLSFGALKTAQDKMDQLEDSDDDRQKKKKSKGLSAVKEQIKEQMKDHRAGKEKKRKREEPTFEQYQEQEQEVEQGGFFEGESDGDSNSDQEDQPLHGSDKKKKNKHAPSEQSSKKRPPRVRTIPGLETKKVSNIYEDIRFSTALGKADADKVRRDYKFLDQYRQDEVDAINKILKDKKQLALMSQREVDELEYQAKSLRSRLQSLKAKDEAKTVLQKYKADHAGAHGNKFYLKKSEERKIIQKHRFENMKKKEVEKSMERKRKRRLGREFRALEFNKPKS